MATMNEEVQIRITADTSGLAAGVNKVKSSFNGLKGTTVGAGNSMNDAIEELKDTLDQIRGMDFFEFFKNNFKAAENDIAEIDARFDTFRVGIQHLKDSFGEIGEALKQEFDATPIGQSLTIIRGKVAGASLFIKKKFAAAALSTRLYFNVAMDSIQSKIVKTFGPKTGTALISVFRTPIIMGKAFIGVLGGVLAALKAVIAAVLATPLGWILAILTAIMAIAGAVKGVMNTAKAIKQVNADAAKIGMSVQAYQQWGYVLESVGVQADELTGLIKTLSDEQAQIAEGSEGASKAFAKLGLSISDITKMNQEQLFTETVERLQQVENAVERTKIAYQIFGEDASHLANVMNMSNEQMRALINNYNLLGGGATQALVDKSNVLSASLSNLRQAWTGLTNVLSELFMPMITAVVNWLTKAIAIVRMFIQALFGLDTTPASGSGKSMAEGMSSYTTATNNATKAVEKLKRAQMGFDELNILPGKDSSGSSGAGGVDIGTSGGGISGGGFSIPDAADLGLEKYQAWFKKYKTLIQDVAAWTLLLVGVGMMMAGVFGGFNIPMILGGAALAKMGISLGNNNGTWDRFFDMIKGVWEKVKGWFNTNVKPIFTKAYWSEKMDSIRAGAQEKLEAVKGVISEKWKVITDWFSKNIAPIFTKTYWFEKFENIRYSLAYKLEQAKTAVSDKWNAVKDWFNKNIAPKFTKTYWFNKFETIRYSLAYKVDQAKQAVMDKWKGIKDWFSKNIAPKFTKTYWFNKFDTIKNGAKSAFNGVISVVEKAVNGIIKKINTLSWSIPNWVPVYGGKKFGFNFKEIAIPRLATGGIAVRSTLANIGENGAEAVLPLERNTGWMDTLADKIAARGGGASKIVLMVDGKELGWASINGINSITKQTGNLQLQLV